mmetsp:Transcript_4103/g.9657  ORF Transcript_4103/g.9657 Transcript_4103/m.9657 type:complete len:192 (-) Transcript_4103:175-750(-)
MARPHTADVASSLAFSAGVAGDRHSGVFGDVHSALRNITKDMAHHRKLAQENDQARQQEIAELRVKLEQERYEFRDQLNKFRYQYDDLVHQKIEGLLEMVDIIHRAEKKDERQHKDNIFYLQSEMFKIKENVKMVSDKWSNFHERLKSRRPLREVTAQIDAETGPELSRPASARPFGRKSPQSGALSSTQI